LGNRGRGERSRREHERTTQSQESGTRGHCAVYPWRRDENGAARENEADASRAKVLTADEPPRIASNGSGFQRRRALLEAVATATAKNPNTVRAAAGRRRDRPHPSLRTPQSEYRNARSA
jgi:hypothetical protein